MKLIDPVCGMPVEKENVFGTSLYKGITYSFCSRQCKDSFDGDPESVIHMKKARDRSVEKQTSEELAKVMDKVAHEVRNPLVSIGGFVRRVYRKFPKGDPERKYLEMVLEEVKRLERMVSKLIDLVPLSVFRKEPVNINDVIMNVLKAFGKEFTKERVEVRTDLMSTLPSIPLDKDRMAEAFTSIIRNAIEAMQGKQKILTITDCLANNQIEIKISDTGKGIPENNIRQIFDPFFSSKMRGPGLGLTFAKKIIQAHGGTISVESKSGKGTTFVISLPHNDGTIGKRSEEL
ncbi:MAG: ATP-binding protein [Nitrospirota bacterium]